MTKMKKQLDNDFANPLEILLDSKLVESISHKKKQEYFPAFFVLRI